MYAQCYLRRTAADGSFRHTIGFIPAKVAIPGKILQLLTMPKGHQDGWEVVSAGRDLFDGKLLNAQSQDYKRMRKASDI